MKRVFLGTFLLASLYVTGGVTAQAATLYMNPSTAEIYPGDSLRLTVRIDPAEGECVNVVNGVIEYDPSIQPVDISRGESIMPIWVEEPTIDTVNNRITFAGGIPNGYCGRIEGDPRLTNTVLDIILQAPGLRIGFGDVNPTSSIQFSPQTSVLLNDGRGTQAPLNTFGAEVYVHKKPRGQVNDEWGTLVAADNQLPQEFSITLNRDDVVFNNRYFIVFNTTDKQTGIDHYEVMEEPIEAFDLFSWGAADAPWIRARSPYVLKDQSLNSTIRVRAIDKAGNEYIATLVPDEAMRGMSQKRMAEIGVAVAGAIVLLILVFLVVLYLRRLRRVRALEAEVMSNDESDDANE